MIKNIKINNFRSIEGQSIELAPLTVIYGPNAAGKSTVFYAMALVKEILTNANRQPSEFFSFGFINIGDFQKSVFGHDLNKEVTISITEKEGTTNIQYKVVLRQKSADIYLEVGKPYDLQMHVAVAFPYPGNVQDQKEITVDGVAYTVFWTGTGAQVNPKEPTPDNNKKANQIAATFNKPILTIKAMDVVPIKRGFTKPTFVAGPPVPFPLSEDEMAAKLASDSYADRHLSLYLEQILNRDFSAKFLQQLGVNVLTTTDRTGKQDPVEVVNDGFGVNQLVYLLGKVLNKETRVACIEEPEINLHPEVVRKLPAAFFDLVKTEKKQLIISTHSETLMVGLQAAVARKEINKSDIVFYFVSKENGVTQLQKQTLTAKGQIEGGLKTYMDVQLQDISAFIDRNKEIEQKPEPKPIEEALVAGEVEVQSSSQEGIDGTKGDLTNE